MIWLGLAVYQTDINCRAYKNCRQSQIFFKKNVAKLLTTKGWDASSKKTLYKFKKCGKIVRHGLSRTSDRGCRNERLQVRKVRAS